MLISLLLGVVQLATISGEVHLSRGRTASNAVVFLEGLERAKPLENAVVDQRERRFIPHISIVTVGTTIQFPNHDTVFHNVFAEFDAKKFDLGMYPRGSSKTQRFDKPGLVALFCSVHSEMSAYVMVVDTPYYAKADDKGHFVIKGVPRGEYTLRAWHESGETESRKVEVDQSQTFEVTTKRR
jgi:plastocyanin